MLDSKIVKKTKLINSKKEYPDNANHPTIINTYECFCGKGTIEEEIVSGFNDRFISLECEHCEKKYQSFIDYYGNDWKVYLQNN